MKNFLTYRLYQYGLWLMLCAMAWCIGGRMVWLAARNVHYTVMRLEVEHQNKYRDTLIFPASGFETHPDIAWVKQDEIRYLGKMFDVKSKTRQGDNIILAGHYDEKDDKLFHILQKLFDDTNTGHNKKQHFTWIPEAIMPGVFSPAPWIDRYTAVIPLIYNVPCIPLHKPSAPLHPPSLSL